MNGNPLDELDEAWAEVKRLRLTDAEREAIEWAARAADPDYTGHTATLRGLLDRLGHQDGR